MWGYVGQLNLGEKALKNTQQLDGGNSTADTFQHVIYYFFFILKLI